jgi:hypothetical protein
VVAAGFVIDPALVGVDEARRRVLALWTPGARVHAHDGRLVITGLPPRRVRTELAPGAPLVVEHGMLAALPLAADEAAALASPGAVVVARGAIAEAVSLVAADAIEPADWLDLDDVPVVETSSLAVAPVHAVVPPPPKTDVRAVIGVAPADARAEQVKAALARAPGANGRRSSLWARLRAWLVPPTRMLPGPGETSPPLSVWGRLRARLAEAVWNSRLGAALGRRNAAYVREVLDLFDRGELDEALRRAIPLGSDAPSTNVALALPRRRDDLRLRFGRAVSAVGMPIAAITQALMRERYKRAAARLEQQGRIDDAAFVLAELLRDLPAAIALLERHQRYAVAARLAEARDADPPLIVRLWFLAGDHAHALDVARTRNAWAAAIAQLERTRDPQADVLRMLWADRLASAGDFVGAVEAAWPVPTSRGLVDAWIEHGLALGGPAAARLLVKRLVGAPARFAEVLPSVLALLDGAEPEHVHARLAMMRELVASPQTPELRTLARPALRALLRDYGVGAEGTTVELLDRMTTYADEVMRADRPKIAAVPRLPSLQDRATPLELTWDAHDAGALRVFDAALLPGGRMLLALGELGVRLVGRDGRTLAHLDQPAARLVVADHGARALAIAPRGQVQRIARLDLAQRRATHWCDVELDHVAPTFDGDLWLVTRGRQVFAVDTTADRWRAVWGIELDQPTARATLRRDAGWFVIEARDGADVEHWYFQGFTLRARRPRPLGEHQHLAAWPAHHSAPPFSFSTDRGAPPIEVAGDIAVVCLDHATMVHAAVYRGDREIATLVLDGASAANVRLSDNHVVLGDDRGRVIAFDLAHGAIRRDLRIV